MTHGSERGGLGPPPPVFQLPRARGRGHGPRPQVRWAIGIAAGLIVLFILLDVGKGIYANALWFQSVGYGSVYRTRIVTRIWLFLAGAGISAAVIAGNLIVARRLAPSADEPDFVVSPDLRNLFETANAPMVRLVLWGVAILFTGIAAISFGSSAAGHWQDILLFAHSTSFGREDPQFHQDLSFYVFKLPVYRNALDWLLSLVFVGFLGTIFVYVLRAVLHGFRFDAPRPIVRHLFAIEAPRWIKLHLSVLIVAFLLLYVGRYWFDRYQLVYSTQGTDTGAFYTDLHATLPMLYVRMAVAFIGAALVLVGLYRGGLALPVVAVGLWILASIVSGIYPAIIQRFSVQPNELSREEPYIARNIDMTRYAYGLDQVQEHDFPANAAATAQEVDANQETINNTRLWDPSPLRSVLSQVQTIRPLFEFRDVDVDRYTIDGKYRQVMLSARELNSGRLPADAQTWVNSRLQFTHGYGYAVAAVNEAQPDGSPTLIERDIPLQGPLQTARPEIYFGEQPDHYIVVDGTEPEFTPTAGGANVQTRFEGNGGVGLGNLFRRAVYAWELADPNILISGAITGNSRLIYRRNVQGRIHEIAPFLQLDADPYLVVGPDANYWMQDAYTVSDRIPYSHQTSGLNYIRNSVKVVVNAYSGETTFYATDPNEPILKAYGKVFPNLFQPISAMPSALRDHIRYPEDLFHIQTLAYLRYHIRDARQFYQKEDQWAIPTEIFGSTEQTIRPYYVIARIPGESKEEFMLILPFSPLNRTNAVAWIAARSDGANYGQLVSFRFPTSESVPGPTQVERRIDSDGRVSQQLTLWNQSGSKVIRGNLLMIPVGNANLFFEPLYLSATNGGNEIPQLKRVVVVNGQDVAMEPTLARALDVLFGRASPSGLDTAGGVAIPSTSPTPTATTAGSATARPTSSPAGTAVATATGTAPPSGTPAGDVTSLVAQAQDAYTRAQDRLRAGDFAGYGAAVDQLKQILDRLQALTGTPAAGR